GVKRFPSPAAGFTVWLGISFAGTNAAALDQNQQAFFEAKIRPVLAEQCYECHNAQKHKGGLALDSRAGWEKGGDSGPAIVPGKAEESLLIKALRHTDPELKMPRNAPKLDERVIADFVEWVNMGAPDPREQPVAKSSEKQRTWSETLAERKKWWCFQPIKNPPSPDIRSLKSKVQSLNKPGFPAFDSELWSKNPIDGFVLAKLVEKGLLHTHVAEPHTLIRRLS